MTKDNKYTSKEAPFKNYRSARMYFLKEFGFERKLHLKSKLHLGNMDKFQKELKAKHSLEELDELKIDMEATVEQMKLIAPLVAMFTFAATLFGASYTSLINSQKEFKTKLNTLVAEYNKARLDNIDPGKAMKEKYYDAVKEAENIKFDFSISLVTVTELVLIGGLVILIGIKYYKRIKENILLLKSVSKAYDEKKEEEESRYRVKLSK